MPFSPGELTEGEGRKGGHDGMDFWLCTVFVVGPYPTYPLQQKRGRRYLYVLIWCLCIEKIATQHDPQTEFCVIFLHWSFSWVISSKLLKFSLERERERLTLFRSDLRKTERDPLKSLDDHCLIGWMKCLEPHHYVILCSSNPFLHIWFILLILNHPLNCHPVVYYNKSYTHQQRTHQCVIF